MSDQLTLPAELREGTGKGAARALRREGRVPAVIYGGKKEPLGVHVEEKLLRKMMETGHFMNSVVELTVGKDKHRTLPKDVQFHPVTSRPIHVDFFRLAKGASVEVQVPVRFVDEEESKGMKRGGVLNVVRHELELLCDAAKIPDEIVISLAGLDIGDSIHINSVELPDGATNAIDRDYTIATLVAPSAMKSQDDKEGEEEVAADEVPATEQSGDEGEDGAAEGDADKGE
ncbi:50S ribosomal protein L25/general stress protein Ctc [Sphingomicrobium astaxanthinifaciens]|uniref:50S ribosomal protein L25/general stress protein Ctc n=1 Tax=Sphingomicrobium astaxanthinifaciens TaxID=1227949 RepID=UPI001FCBC402|nr:50S ribosomal protein L25/general stress protein Ctc [Sphingomicrobium astaxanthinifaciens]MCJ7422056.1 50S ribosomal protein L25/general stress protein Ctc [Sphingomicrobium astaxanthinifaciens]